MTASCIQIGERAPSCYGMTGDRVFYSFEAQYGRPAVLILAGAASLPALVPVLAACAARLDDFAALDADVLLIVDDDPSRLCSDRVVPIPVIDCAGFLTRCGVGARDCCLLVLDRNLRVALRADASTPICDVAACLASLDELPREAAREATQPAPAIVLPNLLPRDDCRALIAQFENGLTTEGAVARIDAGGRVRSVVDPAKKSRRDMLISPDDPAHDHLRETLLRRCAPEIAKAFQARVCHLDRILVSRYDENAGWFRRHRDNTADNVAFREFALSLNLNTEAYQGGHLLFPEYNDHRYRPPTGAGVIFSTAVLHEAAPVTSGQRYVLLTFFHGDAAEARRLDYAARMAD